MQNKFINIDLNKVKSKIALDIERKAKKINKKIAKKVSLALFEFMKTEADKKLKTRRQFYKNNLLMKEAPEIEGFRILLKKPAHWIEKGLDSRNLREDMLKKGEKRRIIPLSEADLTGNGKASKHPPASQVRFRVMSINQPAGFWNTKAIKGVEIFKSAKRFAKDYIKNLKTKK